MHRLILCLGVLGIVATPAFAHKMLVSVTVTDRAVRVEASYEGGEYVATGAKVTLLGPDGDAVATGESDETGVCVLSRPVAGVYTVKVDDNQGHVQKEVIVVREGESSEAHTTQRNRLLMAALGLGLIAGVTIVVMRAKKKSTSINPM